INFIVYFFNTFVVYKSTFSVGYLYAFSFEFLIKAINKVKAPTRPINMVKIITIFPASDKFGVMPNVRPAVEKAENTSNAMGFRPFSPSVMDRVKIAIPMTEKESEIIDNALFTVSFE